MSRRSAGRNGVRGPTSALTSFLREQGIETGPVSLYQRRIEQEQQEDQTVESSEGIQNDAGPSSAAGTSANGASPPKRKRRDGEDDVDSDDLDGHDEDDQPQTPASSKSKKPATAKQTAKAKAAAKKKAKADGTYRSEDEDDASFNAPSRAGPSSSKPPAGAFEKCVKCHKKFTVTKYTLAADPGPGWLCHNCAKAGGQDPFKKPVAPRKKPEDKRKIVHYEEKDRIATLASIAIAVITKHIEDVDALGNIGAENLDQISKIIAKNRSLTPGNASLFYDVDNSSLTLYDCSQLNSDAFCILASLNPNLQRLRLEYCGRMTDSVLSHWAEHLSFLTSVDLLGPFNVRKDAWVSFIDGLENPLEEFAVTQSPRFDLDCLRALRKRCSVTLKSLRLSEIGKMSDEFVKEMQSFERISFLDISRPAHSISEDAFVSLMAAVGGNLQALNVSGHEELGDRAFIQGIRSFAHSLNVLKAADLPNLSNAAVAAVFSSNEDVEMESGVPNTETNEANGPVDPDGMIDDESRPEDAKLEVNELVANVPLLRASLEELDFARNADLATEALAAMLAHSGVHLRKLNVNGWRAASTESLLSIGKSAPHLSHIDLGWCREADNFVVKNLLDECKSLKEVNLYGCNRVTLDCPRRRGVGIRGIEPGAF